jgi:hypothetical protein
MGVSMKVSVEMITELLPPPSLKVNNPIMNTVAELIKAGTNLITKSESPKKNLHAARNQIERGG